VKAVIVALGLGHCGKPTAHATNRSATCAGEQPYLDTAIEAFARTGFDEVAVVLGHNGDILRHYLQDSARYAIAVYCVENLQYQRGDATALLAARAFVGGEPFVVHMATEPLWPDMLLQLVSRPRLKHTICVASRSVRGATRDAAIKVRLDERGQVRDVGMGLRRWQAVAVGTYLFQPAVFEHVPVALAQTAGRVGVHHVLRQLVAQSEDVEACHITSQFLRFRAWPEGAQVYRQPLLSVRVGQEQLVA
jgi:choline kinase